MYRYEVLGLHARPRTPFQKPNGQVDLLLGPPLADRRQPDGRPEAEHYSERIDYLDPRRLRLQAIVVATLAMAIAAWRARSGLAMVGDSGSYLAGAAGLSEGRWFETPLVPSFSELSLLNTARSGGWSPYADFGIGLPVAIALLDLVVPLGIAAGLVNVGAIGLIAAGVVVGPWSPARSRELWLRSALAIGVSCWPILRFTALGVLSEPLFCAALLWLTILLIRCDASRGSTLVLIGGLTIVVGTTRFIGPVVALVVAVVLMQRGVSSRRAVLWGVSTAIVPVMSTVFTAGSASTRVVSFHGLDSSDIFFTARGVGGWFDAGRGDQTATLLRVDFEPGFADWMIVVVAAVAAITVLWTWSASIRKGSPTPLQPALVLAVTLAVAVIPSMMWLDAVVKLENRTLMPSGLLVICAAGWALARRAPTAIAWSVIGVWTVVATHPWQWLDRQDPPRPSDLTESVDALDADFVFTNRADHVWWITRTPARYLPDGYHDLSDRTFDSKSVMEALPCVLAATNGAIVFEQGTLEPRVAEQLDVDSASGRYVRTIDGEIEILAPTGRGC